MAFQRLLGLSSVLLFLVLAFSVYAESDARFRQTIKAGIWSQNYVNKPGCETTALTNLLGWRKRKQACFTGL